MGGTRYIHAALYPRHPRLGMHVRQADHRLGGRWDAAWVPYRMPGMAALRTVVRAAVSGGFATYLPGYLDAPRETLPVLHVRRTQVFTQVLCSKEFSIDFPAPSSAASEKRPRGVGKAARHLVSVGLLLFLSHPTTPSSNRPGWAVMFGGRASATACMRDNGSSTPNNEAGTHPYVCPVPNCTTQPRPRHWERGGVPARQSERAAGPTGRFQ